MDPDPDPAIFDIDLQDANKKRIEKKYAFYFFSNLYITFKDKKSKWFKKILGIKVFLTIFHDDRRIRIQNFD